MASTFIRAFALMLALTGFSATTYTGSSPKGSGGASAQDDGGPTTSSPIPMCAPNDPTHCGLD